MLPRLKKLFQLIVLLSLVAALGAGAASAQERVALVIGNGAYRQTVELPNPPSDAGAIANSFERLGFQVKSVRDGTFDDMRKALLEFGPKARAAQIAVVFYAGHGMEVGGENWLIPVDAAMKADTDADQEAISLRSVIGIVSGASRLGLVILDACRDNPFAAKMTRTLRTRSMVTRGFARIEPSGSVLVAYAAKDGTTAADGTGRNSPFTSALLRNLETPGLEINFLFRNVRDDVLATTNREQEPYVYGSLSRDAIFLKASLDGSTVNVPPPTLPPAISADEITWGLIKDSGNLEQLGRFVRQFPDSPRRRDAEERMSKIANLPITNPQSGPSAASPVSPMPLQKRSTPAPVAKPIARAETTRKQPRSSANCFTFNGRQVCD